MKLSCRILTDVGSVNTFRYASAAQFSAGDQQTVYLQLVDVSLDRSDEGYVPAGRRFVPAAGATMQVVLNSLDQSKKVVRAATQPYVGDASIWRFNVLATDAIRGTIDLTVVLNEAGKVTRGTLTAGVLVAPQLQG